MTDITELATVLRLAAESEIAYREEGDTSDLWQDEASPDNVLALVEALEKAQQHIARQEQILLNQDESLSIRRGELEAAQQERESWRTSFDNERFRADKLKAHIDDIEPVRAAAEKLVRCKGRYHSEQNYRALASLFGVATPDLPPLDGECSTVTVDADVSDRNQPGMVVAVHIDAGDFVKVKGQVYEVEETDFDDHDVTLWFVGGETLKCAAGCQIEVVSAPRETE
ncbi:TPA: hypothetical protein ACS61N_000315 [Klebsiella oxytoca]